MGGDLKIDVYLEPEVLKRSLRDDAKRGLTGRPKELSPKWLYDERGSELFEEITRLPEYYPTRRERSILLAHSREIAHISMAETLIELGSGSSEKTRVLLNALQEQGSLRTYVPFDVSEPMLRSTARLLAVEYPRLDIHGVVGDFDRHLSRLPREGRRLIALLGGTIGNYKPPERSRFLREIASGMAPGDTFLLGTDLVKDHARLHAAYNDDQGVTAEFNRNVLSVINRELGADFRTEAFEHIAWFDPQNSWIEMLLRSRKAQKVRVSELGIELSFSEDEVVRTEVSCKFRKEQVERELSDAGLRMIDWWSDGAGDYGLSLSTLLPR